LRRRVVLFLEIGQAAFHGSFWQLRR
jgi:hypothetical protein